MPNNKQLYALSYIFLSFPAYKQFSVSRFLLHIKFRFIKKIMLIKN